MRDRRAGHKRCALKYAGLRIVASSLVGSPNTTWVEGCNLTARDEVLRTARRLAAASPDGTFTPDEVVSALKSAGTSYTESTIRTHVTSRMCANAPNNHAVTYGDLTRVADGRYRLFQ
ncbi:DUF7669 domain-containing protein [Knoellia sp. CPCC 206435]|uniref:DUF7669 domain-containing protein n=1 Tax=Knoellia terrae TaxID=3404797 RepID=UPI003B427EEA